MPSIDVTSRPSASRPNIKHDRIDRPSTSTVHVPHSPNSHPCFVPVRARSSRSTSSSVLCGAKATSTGSPFSSNAIFAFESGLMSRNVILITGTCDASFRPPTLTDGTMLQRLILAVFVAIAVPPPGLAAQDYRAQALRILKTVPLIDGHNDIPDAIRERGGLDSVDLAASPPKLMTDIPRLRAGGVGGQFWSAYVPVTTIHGGEHPAVYALEQIDLVHRLCRKHPQTFAEAAPAAAVE